MFTDLIFYENPVIFAGAILVLLALSVELPYRYGTRLFQFQHVQDEVWNVLYGGLLALVAFMLGLSYAQAQGRFDARRNLVINEADAIGVAWRRAEQLPPPQASIFRTIIRRYAVERLEAYESPWNVAMLRQTIQASDNDQARLYPIVSDALRAHPANLGISLLLQSLDNVIDISDDQFSALTQHIPTSIILFTVLLVVLGGIFTGFSFARKAARPGVFAAIYVLALALVVQMIVDLDRPQSGLIRVSLDPLRAQIAVMQSK